LEVVTLPALGVSFGAILIARAWMRAAPGSAIRWSLTMAADGPPRRASVAALAWAVAAAGGTCRATCLEQGIALKLLLAAVRVPARVVIGVHRSDRALQAHAWVESDGRVVLGGAEARDYLPLPTAARGPATAAPQ
jgi:hypothetical protein